MWQTRWYLRRLSSYIFRLVGRGRRVSAVVVLLLCLAGRSCGSGLLLVVVVVFWRVTSVCQSGRSSACFLFLSSHAHTPRMSSCGRGRRRLPRLLPRFPECSCQAMRQKLCIHQRRKAVLTIHIVSFVVVVLRHRQQVAAWIRCGHQLSALALVILDDACWNATVLVHNGNGVLAVSSLDLLASKVSHRSAAILPCAEKNRHPRR